MVEVSGLVVKNFKRDLVNVHRFWLECNSAEFCRIYGVAVLKREEETGNLKCFEEKCDHHGEAKDEVKVRLTGS